MFFIINKRKYNYFIITNLIILSLIPGFIFNYSNYSMSEKINIFSNDKNLIKLIQREYNENIISDKKLSKNLIMLKIVQIIIAIFLTKFQI